MRFKRWLITEINMTVDQALGALGLSSSDLGDMMKIKKAFKELSKKHHPDHGGTKERQQQLNAAWDTLKRLGNKKAVRSKVHDANWKQTGLNMRQMMLHAFKPDMFVRHFNKYTNEKLYYDMKRIRPDEKIKYAQHYAGFTVDFYNKDRSIVFEMSINASIADAYNEKTLGFGTIQFPLSIVATGFFKNKKQKFSRSDWKFTSDHAFFRKPEVIFPDKKLRAIFSGKTSARKFQRRDMVAFLTKKLKASFDGEFASIPLFDEYTLYIFRSTFMRQAVWMVNGIYRKWSRIAQGVTVTMPENEDTAMFLERIQKEIKRQKPQGDDKVAKTVNILLQKYKDSRK